MKNLSYDEKINESNEEEVIESRLQNLNEEEGELSEQEFLKRINELDKVSEKEIEESLEKEKESNSSHFEKPRYSKNLTDEEAKRVEQIIKWTAKKFWYGSSSHKETETIDDLVGRLHLKLLEQSVLKDKEGNVLKDKKGNIIIREDQIARNMGEIRFWIKMAAIDCYRSTTRKASHEDRNLVIDMQASEDNVESGENKLYQNSESGREAMRKGDAVVNMEFEQLFDALQNDEIYDDVKAKYNLKPRHIEEIKKFVSVKAYHAGINEVKVIDLYKKYELELDEEKKEMVARCEATKSSGGITDDVMLKAYYGIGTGIDAGSAGRITRKIPMILEEVIKTKLPGYINF